MTNLPPADTLTIGTARFPANPTPSVGIVRTPPAERLAHRKGAAEALRAVLAEQDRHADHPVEGDACIWAAVHAVAGRLGINLTGEPA